MQPALRKVVIAEDDPAVSDVVCRYLRHEGFEPLVTADGKEALQLCIDEQPDLAILDVMMPSMTGVEVCRQLRAVSPIPVILLTARTEEHDRLSGFGAGADDYVTKPFSPKELMARVHAVTRRLGGGPENETILTVTNPTGEADTAAIEIDVAKHVVLQAGEPVSMTSREFELLTFLARNRGTAFRREELLEQVWGYTIGDTSTVTVHVRRLREKLEADPSNPTIITTVWGVGYRLEPAQP